MTHRTTSQLVKQAVAAFKEAGLTVGAVEVHSGGFVRVVAIEAISDKPCSVTEAGGMSCDEAFDCDT